MRRPLAALLIASLTLVACGGDDDGPSDADRRRAVGEREAEPIAACDHGAVDHVTVSGEFAQKPTITLDGLVAVELTQCAVVQDGEGVRAAEGDILEFAFTFVNGRTGEEYASSFKAGVTATLPLDNRPIRALRQALTGSQAGSRIVVAASPEDGYGLQGGDPDVGLDEHDTLVMVIDVIKVQHVLPRAEGTAVTPAEGLPTVRLGQDGRPSVVIPKGDPPTDLVVQTLIEGTGPVVAEGQEISAHYVGVLWSNGKEFDSSWETTPIAARLELSTPEDPDGLIAGWVQGLAGKTVGSQVLLVIPPAFGYGEAGQPAAGISGTETIVFVVDLLAAR